MELIPPLLGILSMYYAPHSQRSSPQVHTHLNQRRYSSLQHIA